MNKINFPHEKFYFYHYYEYFVNLFETLSLMYCAKSQYRFR